jgi:hypothetical protein
MLQAFVIGRKSARFLFLGLALCAFGISFPKQAKAQNIVVAGFSDRTRTRLGYKARISIARELKKQGARLVAIKQYLRVARKSRVKPRQATQAWAIKRLSRKLRLAGVIKGTVVRKKGRFFLRVSAINSRGKVKLKKAYRLRRPTFPQKNAAILAKQIMAKLAPGANALVAESTYTKPSQPATQEPPPEPAQATQETLPAWARQPEPTTPSPTAQAPSSQPMTKTTPTVSAQPSRRIQKRSKSASSLPDLRLAVGSSVHIRSGLEPEHKASFYPGIRVDGHLYLGTLMDVAVIRNIGFGGMFDMAMGLKYGYSNADSSWDASQLQWRVEMTYRWAMNVSMNPTFVFKAGYGSLAAIIDAPETETNAFSVSYKAPRAGIALYLTLIDPYLQFYVSGDALLSAEAGEELSGFGWGLNIASGLDFDLFGPFSVGLGYEMTQMKYDAFSDTYHALYLRFGYKLN